MLDDFRISRGGPFYQLQQRMLLLHDHGYRARSRSLLFVGIAWGVPLLLSMLAGQAWGPFAERPFLLSYAAWGRFFVAIGLFVLMERAVEQRLRSLLAHFSRAPILEETSFGAAAEAVTGALKQRDAALPEVVCLVLAIAASLLVSNKLLDEQASTWAVRTTAQATTLTPAGWWCVIVSNPLLVFLMTRWFWRLHVWSNLLRRIARLDLRLAASHPDGRAGLEFIGRYPNTFALFVLGVSCVLAAAVGEELLERGVSTKTYGYVMAGWLVIVLGLLSYPLLAFRKPLEDLKTRALAAASAQATEYFRSRDREILNRYHGRADDQPDKPPDDSVSDPSTLFGRADRLSTILISRSTLLPVSAAALLPFVAVGVTQLPMQELLRIVKRLMLL